MRCVYASEKAYRLLKEAARRAGVPVKSLIDAYAETLTVKGDLIITRGRNIRVVPKEYFEKLVRENSELKAELNRLRSALKRIGDERAAIRELREERERLAGEVERLRAEAAALEEAKARLMEEADEIPVNPAHFISLLREHGLLMEVKKMLIGEKSDAENYLVGDDTYYAIYMLRDEILRADPSGDAPVKKQLLWIL